MNEKVFFYVVIALLFLAYSFAIFLWGRQVGIRANDRGTGAVSGSALYRFGRATERIEKSVDDLRNEVDFNDGVNDELVQRLRDGCLELRKRTEKMRDLVRNMRQSDVK